MDDISTEELLVELLSRMREGDVLTLDQWDLRLHVEVHREPNVRIIGRIVESYRRPVGESNG